MGYDQRTMSDFSTIVYTAVGVTLLVCTIFILKQVGISTLRQLISPRKKHRRRRRRHHQTHG
ncbi:hypothetical protein DC3_13390 [Deinococcus cellulosilyticus NBRC 106333 = KACC 11606]|uniref:Uncharacterized protein n=2 Tax=Deinococcus cellulosilyticus TaxID=401558 RepID=A0A511MYM7_DEIC1|nr:hypothetical protein DC3_13390 [Deinococcus cellulosilyticus NBRC 106333 = KACC 11606]